ncbi:MAG: hypothetical protein GY820_24090 [Gammaproteobacteria bacterium]|nr:hypothetical protein [Gammaproteobacteria bacterium]
MTVVDARLERQKRSTSLKSQSCLITVCRQVHLLFQHSSSAPWDDAEGGPQALERGRRQTFRE